MIVSIVMDWQAGETVALVVMAAFEAVTLFFYFREKASKDRAEKELKIIKRRGEAPFLQPSATPFQFIEFIFEKDERRMWTPNEQNVLCFVRDEVTENLAPENAVVLAPENAVVLAPENAVVLAPPNSHHHDSRCSHKTHTVNQCACHASPAARQRALI